MTEPQDPAPPTLEGAPAGNRDLEAYIRANRASYTEDALRRQALAAGHPPAAVEAALAATRDIGAPASTGHVTRNIFLAYLAVYLVLDVLMLLNATLDQGALFRNAGAGIFGLSVALGAGFLASLVWIASRRIFGLLVGIGFAGLGFSLMNQGGVSFVLILGAGIALIAVAVIAGRRSAAGPAPAASSALLMSIPLLILLAIGGLCVASGYPIPQPA